MSGVCTLHSRLVRLIFGRLIKKLHLKLANFTKLHKLHSIGAMYIFHFTGEASLDFYSTTRSTLHTQSPLQQDIYHRHPQSVFHNSGSDGVKNTRSWILSESLGRDRFEMRILSVIIVQSLYTAGTGPSSSTSAAGNNSRIFHRFMSGSLYSVAGSGRVQYLVPAQSSWRLSSRESLVLPVPGLLLASADPLDLLVAGLEDVLE